MMLHKKILHQLIIRILVSLLEVLPQSSVLTMETFTCKVNQAVNGEVLFNLHFLHRLEQLHLLPQFCVFQNMVVLAVVLVMQNYMTLMIIQIGQKVIQLVFLGVTAMIRLPGQRLVLNTRLLLLILLFLLRQGMTKHGICQEERQIMP